MCRDSESIPRPIRCRSRRPKNRVRALRSRPPRGTGGRGARAQSPSSRHAAKRRRTVGCGGKPPGGTCHGQPPRGTQGMASATSRRLGVLGQSGAFGGGVRFDRAPFGVARIACASWSGASMFRLSDFESAWCDSSIVARERCGTPRGNHAVHHASDAPPPQVAQSGRFASRIVRTSAPSAS